MKYRQFGLSQREVAVIGQGTCAPGTDLTTRNSAVLFGKTAAPSKAIHEITRTGTNKTISASCDFVDRSCFQRKKSQS
jgi:hypothetical protein